MRTQWIRHTAPCKCKNANIKTILCWFMTLNCAFKAHKDNNQLSTTTTHLLYSASNERMWACLNRFQCVWGGHWNDEKGFIFDVSYYMVQLKVLSLQRTIVMGHGTTKSLFYSESFRKRNISDTKLSWQTVDFDKENNKSAHLFGNHIMNRAMAQCKRYKVLT